MSRIKSFGFENKGWIGYLYQAPDNVFKIEVAPSKYKGHYFSAIMLFKEPGCLVTRQPESEEETKFNLICWLRKYGANMEDIQWEESNDFVLLKDINWDVPPLTNPELN